jgi:hypothetical protein
MTNPCLHYELNEAWIVHGDDRPNDDSILRANSANSIRDVRGFVEHDSDGRPTLRYSGGIGNDGRFLLHGASIWYHANGTVQRTATHAFGQLTGAENFHDSDGQLLWTREHGGDGSVVWTNYWSDGKIRTQSTWHDMHAEGTAFLNDPSGKQVYRVEFQRGIPTQESGSPGEY